MPVKGTGDFPVLQPKENVRIPNQPNVQGVMEEYAKSQNSISAIGAQVAKSASNAMAVRLGYETGKNPQGDLLPSITEFDKNFVQSYQAQAQAVLTNQADKLLNNAHMEMSKATRITPDLIARTRNQLQTGLARIAENAPTEIKGKLETAFESQLMSNMSSYNDRMIREQRADQAESVQNALYNNIKKIQELGSQQDDKGALNLLSNTQAIAQGGAAGHLISKENSSKYIDMAKQAYLDGKFSAEALQKKKEGKYEEFAKDYAENKPSGMTTEQWINTGKAFSNEINFYDSLTSQSQSLAMAKFKLSLIDGTASAKSLIDLEPQVSPQKYIEAKIDFIKASKKLSGLTEGAEKLLGNLSNRDAYIQATPKDRNIAWRNDSERYYQQQNQAGTPISRDEAKLHIAMNAIGPIDEYNAELNSKALSLNPQDIASAGHSMNVMYDNKMGEKLKGVSDEAVINYHAFLNNLAQGMPAQEAAIQAKETSKGKSQKELAAQHNAWTAKMNSIKSSGQTIESYFLSPKFIDLAPTTNVSNALLYANRISEIHENIFTKSGGNLELADKITKKFIDQSFGTTKINKKPQFAYQPLERSIGLPDNAYGLINADIAKQLESQVAYTKQQYDKGISFFYWEVKPQQTLHDITQEIIAKSEKGFNLNVLEKMSKKFNESQPVEVLQHFKDGSVKKYNVHIEASPYATQTTDPQHPLTGGWEIMLENEQGVKSLSRLDAITGRAIYNPNNAQLRLQYAELFFQVHHQPKKAKFLHPHKEQ